MCWPVTQIWVESTGLKVTCVTGWPVGLVLLMMFSSLLFSHCHMHSIQSGWPPWAIKNLPQGEKSIETISVKFTSGGMVRMRVRFAESEFTSWTIM